MSKRSNVQLAGASRLNGNPLWNRAFQVKILDKFYKGVSSSALLKLQFGSSGKIKSRLAAENNKVLEVLTKRGPGSLKKHPPADVEDRLLGREPIVPSLETILDVNLFISDSGNLHTDEQTRIIEKRFEESLLTRDQKVHELQRLNRLIHSQTAGTSTNTTMSRFRAYFQRSMVLYMLSSTTDVHGRTIQTEGTASSGACTRPEDYLKESLRDICLAINIRNDIAPAFYNRALILRKLKCHETACGDLMHGLKLLYEDVGNNELAMIKYRKLAALLEREVGLFLESAMEYDKVKGMTKEHLQHERAKHLIEKQRRLAKRMKDENERFKIQMKAKQDKDAKKNGMREKMRRLSTKFKMLPPMSPMNVKKTSMSGADTGAHGKGEGSQSFLSIVHTMTGGKHMSAVLKAKSKFLHGLLTPIAKAMAGTIPGHRTVDQIERIVDFVYTTNSNDLISLEPKPLKQVCQWLGHESVAAGQYVYKFGDPKDGFYVLASGMAQVMVKNPKSNYEIAVKTLHPGDSFGKIHFPTDEEQREETAVGGGGPSEQKKVPVAENSSIISRAWASDSMDYNSKCRQASIYCSRHCELLFLKWSHAAEQKRERLDSDESGKRRQAEENKQRRQKEAIHAFQGHTIQRRFHMLRNCSVFKYVKDKDLQGLAALGSIHHWHQGTVVMRQGEVMSEVFVIVRGVCEIRKRRKMSVVKAERAEFHSPTGEGEDKLAAGMMWQQQYHQHMGHRLGDIINANREAAYAEANGSKGAIPTQWVKVSMIKGGDICGEMVLLNPTKTTVSPVEVIADSSVDALVFSVEELKPFLNHGMFSGRTRGELINSVGMHVPSEVKVSLDLAVKRRWVKKKSRIIKSHVVGNRHLHPVGWVDPNPDA